jgi:hypothetical protein
MAGGLRDSQLPMSASVLHGNNLNVFSFVITKNRSIFDGIFFFIRVFFLSRTIACSLARSRARNLSPHVNPRFLA